MVRQSGSDSLSAFLSNFVLCSVITVMHFRSSSSKLPASKTVQKLWKLGGHRMTIFNFQVTKLLNRQVVLFVLYMCSAAESSFSEGCCDARVKAQGDAAACKLCNPYCMQAVAGRRFDIERSGSTLCAHTRSKMLAYFG